jgi:hypothetical protein
MQASMLTAGTDVAAWLHLSLECSCGSSHVPGTGIGTGLAYSSPFRWTQDFEANVNYGFKLLWKGPVLGLDPVRYRRIWAMVAHQPSPSEGVGWLRVSGC